MYYFKLGFVAEDNIRPTKSKNASERIKRNWTMPIGYSTVKEQFIVAMDAVEFERILQIIKKGDTRQLGFDLPESEASYQPRKQLLDFTTLRRKQLPDDGYRSEPSGSRGG